MKKAILLTIKLLIKFYIAYCKKRNKFDPTKLAEGAEATIDFTSTTNSGFKQGDFDQLKATLQGYDTGFIDTKADIDGTDPITVTASAVSDVPLTLKAATSQTGDLLNVTDDSDAILLEVTSGGGLSNVEGVRTVTTQYGAGLGLSLYGENVPEHTNQSGYYDHTGGTYEKLFTKTSGDDFTQADADNGTHLLLTGITGSFPMCEIKIFIDADNVIVDGYGWDGDIASVGTPSTFLSIPHPSFVSGDGNKHEFNVGANGEFEVHSYGFTGEYIAEFELDSAADSTDAVKVIADANGYSNVDALVVDYNAGDIQPGDSGGGLGVLLNVSGATSADSTTEVNGVIFVLIDGSSATTNAITTLPGFTNILNVVGAVAADMDYGYEVASGVVTDRQAAYSSAGTNVQIFDADNDYILIGDDAPFEIISVDLVTGANQNINATFEYSTGNNTWSTLSLSTDGTTGFTKDGVIVFDAPGDWAVGNQAEDAADITSAYYVKITRTRNTLVTSPTENIFQIFASKAASMKIKGNGVISLPYLSAIPSGVENGDIWMESDGLHVYYNGAEKVVSDGAP